MSLSVDRYLLENRLLLKIPKDQNVIVEEKKCFIKKHNKGESIFGYGIFATEFIAKNTIFMDSNTYNNKINDLAYHNTLKNYDCEENILKNINIGCIQQLNVLYDFDKNYDDTNIFYYALKDIHPGEQLSRFYGVEYWQEEEFWNNLPNSNYRKTNDYKDLPSKWVIIDTVCKNLLDNNKVILYGKKNDDKYLYVLSKDPKYYVKSFPQKDDKFMEVSKEDFSPFMFNDNIYKGLYRTKYLVEIKDIYYSISKTLPNGTRATFINPITKKTESKIVIDKVFVDLKDER